jgi:hypothetical protein
VGWDEGGGGLLDHPSAKLHATARTSLRARACVSTVLGEEKGRRREGKGEGEGAADGEKERGGWATDGEKERNGAST